MAKTKKSTKMAKPKKPGSGRKTEMNENGLSKMIASNMSTVSTDPDPNYPNDPIITDTINHTDTSNPDLVPQFHLRPPVQSKLLNTPSSRATPVFSQLAFEIDSTSSLPIPELQPKEIKKTDYKDRKDEAVSQLLERFTKLVELASLGKKAGGVDDGSAATREAALAQGLAMEVESAALVKAAEDLLQLTRELKEMWLFGALREIGEGEGEGKIDEDSVKVGEIVERILRNDAQSPNPKLTA